MWGTIQRNQLPDRPGVRWKHVHPAMSLKGRSGPGDLGTIPVFCSSCRVQNNTSHLVPVTSTFLTFRGDSCAMLPVTCRWTLNGGGGSKEQSMHRISEGCQTYIHQQSPVLFLANVSICVHRLTRGLWNNNHSGDLSFDINVCLPCDIKMHYYPMVAFSCGFINVPLHCQAFSEGNVPVELFQVPQE